jgi:3-isopropylmalate/(R)-2-methylmalate dehydratase small subunit
VLIAPSFADIFASNCTKIGLVPIELPEADVRRLMERVDAEHGTEMTVDLEEQTITAGSEVFAFPFDPFRRRCLLEGLDDIGLTLGHADAIAAFEAAHPAPVDTLALTR